MCKTNTKQKLYSTPIKKYVCPPENIFSLFTSKQEMFKGIKIGPLNGSDLFEYGKAKGS